MNLDLTERLDPELKGLIKQMLSQMPPNNFNDLPAAPAEGATIIFHYNAFVGDIVGVGRFKLPALTESKAN